VWGFIGSQAVFDSFFWAIALFAAALLRFEFDIEKLVLSPLLVFAGLVALANFGLGKILGVYRFRFNPGSLDEMVTLAILTAVVGGLATIAVLFGGLAWDIPRSVTLIASPFFLVMTASVRVFRRLTQQYFRRSGSSKRTVIYGAGDLAQLLITRLLSDSNSEYFPVGLVDDDPAKSNRWIAGVKMKGNGKNLRGVLKTTKAEAIVIAIPRATSSLFQKVDRVATELGIEVLAMPSLSEMMQSPGSGTRFQSLGIEDLVGRRAVDTDVSSIGTYLSGKRVLITGAGGSIGVELCRQVAKFSPAELIFLDRDETGLQTAQLATSNSGLLDTSDFVLADIREAELILHTFSEKRPQVVFHAAALKHLPVLERFPLEAWKTNVLGTLNVLLAAEAVGVETFINVSTDKASGPTSILGKSKHFAEQLTAWFSTKNRGKYVSVRFGNVLGSRGSLIPTLSHQIREGGPVTITDPEATRYFMTIPEACQLVLQAGAMGQGKEIFVLDMGNPVKILDVANNMIRLARKKVEIVFTGLREGEKLHEEVHSANDILRDSGHPLIYRIDSQPLDPRKLSKLFESFLSSD
jgi:dTDP-glucose 4,6-dehydratase